MNDRRKSCHSHTPVGCGSQLAHNDLVHIMCVAQALSTSCSVRILSDMGLGPGSQPLFSLGSNKQHIFITRLQSCFLRSQLGLHPKITDRSVTGGTTTLGWPVSSVGDTIADRALRRRVVIRPFEYCLSSGYQL